MNSSSVAVAAATSCVTFGAGCDYDEVDAVTRKTPFGGVEDGGHRNRRGQELSGAPTKRRIFTPPQLAISMAVADNPQLPPSKLGKTSAVAASVVGQAVDICLESPKATTGEKFSHKAARDLGGASWRWLMLAILCLDICVSYIPYYTFVPIMTQSMQAYGVNEADLNTLCIIYALVYVPGAFLTGPIVSAVGTKWTFVLATALNAVGCVCRCGPKFVMNYLPLSMLWYSEESTGVAYTPTNETVLETPVLEVAALSFRWLTFGQALCAAGQPFLVNSTSEMGVEWFPPNERPTAAMVSNLMNFIGSSLSFMLPSLIVDEKAHGTDVVEAQLLSLLKVQVIMGVIAFATTLLLYRSSPPAQGVVRERPVNFASEVMGILSQSDFWLVNWQFAIFVAIGHAFDAVEGTMLEHYGYNASLTSWTGLSCCVGSVLSTIIESRYIDDPKMYKMALLVSNLFVVLSLVLCYMCLDFRMHQAVFVIGVGIIGLATPGWGCSCELTSEVCYPAREATVGSLLEVFGNLLGVAGIVATQWLIDAGLGARVFLIMAVGAGVGASLLLGLSGQLYRSVAEAAAEEGKSIFVAPPPKLGVHVISSLSRVLAVVLCSSVFVIGVLPLMQPPLGEVRSELRAVGLELEEGHEVNLLDSDGSLRGYINASVVARIPQEVADVEPVTSHQPSGASDRGPATTSTLKKSSAHKRISRRRRPKNVKLLENGSPEPLTYILRCADEPKVEQRISLSLQRMGMAFQMMACSSGSQEEISEAVRTGLLPKSAEYDTLGFTRKGRRRAEELKIAITHLKVMRTIQKSCCPGNVINMHELILDNFPQRRNQLLQNLPEVDFVNLDTPRPAGKNVKFRHHKGKLKEVEDRKWMSGKVHRMSKSLSPLLNLGLTNYIVSRKGARSILKAGQSYDAFGKYESFNMHLLSRLYEKPAFAGFVVRSNTLSTQCNVAKMPSACILKL